ncbi:hypothetical protein [Dongia sp.]|uniref:hypothetical protein n=1 Tax=Dongia sp. TaxID=1977262 RepID=UPI0035B39C7C
MMHCYSIAFAGGRFTSEQAGAGGWQYPTDSGKGGMVFMHNGDNMARYPDHGPHRHSLVRDSCQALIAHSGTPLNRF